MCEDVLTEFGGRRFRYIDTGGKGKRGSWDRLLDTDLGIQSDDKGKRTTKEVLMERVLIPFSEGDTPGFGAAYSTILFGPPVSFFILM